MTLLIRRTVRTILAAYVLVWFTMVVPSHTRGVVTIPGAAAVGAVAAGSSSCCHATAPTNPDDRTPTKEQQKRCAVCFVASMISTPVVYAIDLRPGDHVANASNRAESQLRSHDFPAPFWPTGPPAAL